jgi:hypothetical protein
MSKSEKYAERMSSVLRAPSGPLGVLDQTDNGEDQKESARYSAPPQKHQRPCDAATNISGDGLRSWC